jgi:hypothetical protein
MIQTQFFWAGLILLGNPNRDLKRNFTYQINRMNTKESLVKDLLGEWPLAFVFGCILFMLHPMLHADFGLIDDHEIISILGRDDAVRISEFFPLVAEYSIEANGRFRPGYYVLRILEAFFVGSDASLWYTNRLLFALVSALALYWGLRVFLHPFSAGVVTLLLFSGPQNEIWTGLGPPEAYGVPLVLVGLACLAVQLGRHHWQPARLFLGFALLLLAGFIKESFIPVLPAALVFIYLVIPFVIASIIPDRDKLKFPDVLILFLLITGLATQVWLTAKMLRSYGHQYSAQISFTSFVYTIKPMLLQYARDTLWFIPLIAGIVTLLPRHLQEWRRQGWRVDFIKAVVLLAAGGFLILGPQWIVYGGSFFFAGRYLTPGNLFIVFAAALGLYLLSSNLGDGRHAELRGVVAGLLIAVALFKILGTYREANVAALSTHKFQAKLGEIVQLKTQYPDFPLLFYSTNVFDREPLVSVAVFLAAKLPNSEKPFLNAFSWETGADSPLKIRLARIIQNQSLEGDQYFAKIADFRGSDGRCIAVVFSGFSEDFPCDYSVRVRES